MLRCCICGDEVEGDYPVVRISPEHHEFKFFRSTDEIDKDYQFTIRLHQACIDPIVARIDEDNK